MNFRLSKSNLRSLFYLLIFFGIFACARVGMPEGGDYDETPPVFLGSDPAPNATRYGKNKIALTFDEYLALEKPSETVIITPPQKKAPIIKAVGKKITVELRDSLIANTTYTFDFTNGIVDNNEKNALEGFTFAFSTGDVLDSLVISGLLLNAEDLEPLANVMVGIHSDLSDTAFTALPFLRTSQTNEIGQFKIRNVAPGTYRLYALQDANRDFKFDQPGEAIAFCDSLIVPSFEAAMRQDTIWKDSLTVDTIREIAYTRFLPDDVLMLMFKEHFPQQYLSKTERLDSAQLTWTFNESLQEMPEVRLLMPEAPADWYVSELSADSKTLTYWLRDSLLYLRDTIKVETVYFAHDTLHEYIPQIDTLNFMVKKSKNQQPTATTLRISVSPEGTMEVYDTLRITFATPVDQFDRRDVRILQKVDTLWETRDFPLVQDSLNPRIWYVNQAWKYGDVFRIQIDSAKIHDIYGKGNDSVRTEVKIRLEKEYAHLFMQITGNATQGFGELLNSSQKVVKKAPLNNGEIAFYDVKPGQYYVRYIEDANGNGVWDTGLYAERRQAEQVYYYPTSIDLKAFMELEQSWNVSEVPLFKQKPLEIVKNKPKEKQQKSRNEERKNKSKTNSNANSSSSNRSSSGSMSSGLSRMGL